jgi:hypothetical protein
VTAIACSPQGQFIAVAAGTEFLIFDSARSKPVQRLQPHGAIRSIAWIDEEILVTGQGVPWFLGFHGGPGIAGPSIFVWNGVTGAELLRFGSDLFGVRGIAVSPDGRTLLVSGRLGKTDAEGSSLDLWEVSSGRLLVRLARVDPPVHETLPFFTGVAFTPDGSIALAGCDRYTVPAHLRTRDRPELPAWWRRAIGLGCYFSVNPAMLHNDRGRKLVGALPADRLLTETDAPFTQINDRLSAPSDVKTVVEELAALRREASESTRQRISANLRTLVGAPERSD